MGELSAADLLVFARVSTGLLFLLSAGAKLRSFAEFEAALRQFGVVPQRRVRVTARSVVAAEVAVTLLLAFGGVATAPGFILAAALLVAFSAVLVHALARGNDVACKCFGGEQRISHYDVVRNSLMLSVAFIGVVALGEPAQKVDGWGVALVSVIAVTWAAAVVHIADIIETLRKPL